MFWRGLKRFLGTTALVGIGVAAIAIEKVVSEQGPEVITGPASALVARLRPLVVESGAAAWIEGWQAGGAAASATGVVADEPPTRDASAPRVAADDPGPADAPGTAVAPPTTAPDLQVQARCDADANSMDAAVLGDRLALRFFEQGELASAPSDDGTPRSESIVFERLDLSGSYEVGANGAVSLPAIGYVDVIGRSLPCIEALVALAASERLRLNGSVSAAFAARPPVLVQGTVRAPGAHAYSPGLTVERVLAQAGAITEAEPVSALQWASLQAREQELNALAASLTLERARIDAALAGDMGFATDAEAWAPVAEILGADRVGIERSVLLSDLAEEQAQQDRSTDRINDLVARISAAQDHLRTTEAQLGQMAERQGELADRLQQGVITDDRVEEARLRLMTMERAVLERRDAVLQLEAELRLARHEAAVREAERRARLAQAALDATKEGSALREQLRTVRAQLAVRSGGDAQLFAVTIQRPEPEGVKRFAAEPGTSVQPGDLVTVASADAALEPFETPTSGAGSGVRVAPAIAASWP